LVYGIDGNNVVGSYSDAYGNGHGFLFNGSTWITLSSATIPSGISGNNIVGTYNGPDPSYWSGCIYNGSYYHMLNYPNSVDTSANGISGNNIVGNYYNLLGTSALANPQGFLYDGNSYSTINELLRHS
jgi:hypothetical protein